MLIEYCKAHFTPKDIDPVTPQPGFDAGTTLNVIIAIYGIGATRRFGYWDVFWSRINGADWVENLQDRYISSTGNWSIVYIV